MKRTPLTSKYVQELAKINDRLCFYEFTRSEIENAVTPHLPSKNESFLPTVFACNPSAARINVKLGSLPKFMREHDEFTLGSYVSTSYEMASHYTAAALKLLLVTNGLLEPKPPKRAGPETVYRQALADLGFTIPDQEVHDALSFIRLRRNHFVHLNKLPSPLFIQFCSAVGVALNKYWQNARGALDFTVATAGPISEVEAIAMIKILRICVDALDTHLAGILNVAALGRSVAEEIFAVTPSKINADVVAMRVRKLNAVFRHRYGGLIPTAEAERLARTVFTR